MERAAVADGAIRDDGLVALGELVEEARQLASEIQALRQRIGPGEQPRSGERVAAEVLAALGRNA